MARPIANNAEYFPHQTAMRNHRKLRAVRSKFGIEGYAVYVMLLEVIADANGFTIPWGGIETELIAGDFGVKTEALRDIIEYLHTLDLVQVSDTRITCKSLLETLQPLIKRRERDRTHRDIPAKLSTPETPQDINSAEFSTPQTGLSAPQNTQSIVEYSRVDKSRVDKRLEGELEANAPPPYPDSEQEVLDAGACDGVKPDVCRRFWVKYSSQGWVTGSGVPITNWRMKLREWKVSESSGRVPGADRRPVESANQKSHMTFEKTAGVLADIAERKRNRGQA